MPKRLVCFLLLVMMNVHLWSQSDKTSSDGFLVKPYLQYSTKNSIRILWETKEVANSRVEFGEAQFDVDKANLSQQVKQDGYRLMHEVELVDLKASTNYFWRVVSTTASGEQWISETYSFKTAIQDNDAFLFALVGDSQRNNKTPWAWDSIARKVWQERPNFIVHAGDLVDWGPKKTDWTKHFFPGGQALMARIPMYTVLGNHEGDADLYYQYMANPMPEYRYTFTYGNAQFFMIDTNRDVSEGSEQYNWLEQELAKSTTTWKIVIHHHPPYSSESDDHGDTFKEASTMGTKSRKLTPLYDKYGVDFCLFGHTHIYERTWPLKENRIHQREGTIYINSGGAGGGLETLAPTRNWFTLDLQEGHHFCTFAIFNKTLLFKAIDHQGRVFDSFQMDKDRDKDKVVVVEPPAPIISSKYAVFEKTATVELESGLSNLDLYYTLDGSTPNQQSEKYKGPIVINRTLDLQARAYTKKGNASRVVVRSFTKQKASLAASLESTKPGLRYRLYNGDWRGKEDTFFAETAIADEGILKTLDVASLQTESSSWGIIIEGYLSVPETGTYSFFALDARGLEIKIDDQPLIQSKGEIERRKQMVLAAGKHKLYIKSFQRNWRKSLRLGYYDEVMGRISINPGDLSH